MAPIDYSSIVKRSWKLALHNKWLWVYGVVLAMFGGSGSFKFPGGGGGGGSRTPSIKDVPKDLDLPQKTSYVLGEATASVKSWASTISPTTWLLLFVVMGIIIIISVIIAWVFSSWAKASLIAGLLEADEEKTPTLATSSPKGIAKIKHMMLLGLISGGLIFGIIIILVVVFFIGTFVFSLVAPVLSVIWILLTTIVGGLTAVVLFILFAMTVIYAERLIVIKNMTPWQAFKKGFSLSRGEFIPTAVMGIINSLLGCTLGCLTIIPLLIIFGIPFFILVFPLFSQGAFRMPSIFHLLGIGLLFMLFIYSVYVINAFLTVFRFGTWNLLFKEVMKEEKNEK